MRQLRGEQDIRAWVELFNESFIDHWNHQDVTAMSVRHWLKNPHYKPELNLVAVAPDGTFAAFCIGYINQEEITRTRRNEGWIKLLGTRRGFRKLGLGRAMLLAGMSQLREIGVERVKLGVDAQSMTNATRLYESVGFQPIYTWLSYVKKIQF
jgi:ribosomal protein S18 acetylase RimI-like enzyme